MKGKRTTMAELQDALNKRLGVFAGRKYTGTEFHEWYGREITNEFEKREIKELRASTWGIVTDMSEQGVCFFAERVAEVNIDFKADKRYTINTRGVILSITVEFRKELLPLSLDEARRFLFEGKRNEMIRAAVEKRDKAYKQAEEAEKEWKRLAALTF